jgi:hypothetical protein
MTRARWAWLLLLVGLVLAGHMLDPTGREHVGRWCQFFDLVEIAGCAWCGLQLARRRAA